MQIVALLFRRVGDSLMATPALRAVKRQYPEAHLAVIAEPQVVRVFEHNPMIDEIRPIGNGPSIFTLSAAIRRKGTPDIALDFLSDPRSALGCLLSRARRRVGFERRVRSQFYTDRIARQDPQHPMYSAMHKLALARAVGAQHGDVETEFYLTDEDRAFASTAWNERGWNEDSNVAAFFINSRREHKRWPLSHFAGVVTKMQAESLATPVVLLTPGDESAVSALRAEAHLPDANVVRAKSLGQLGGILERCQLLIGNDGGPKHIAVALHVPTVTVFGPDSAAHWTPPNSAVHIAVAPEGEESSIADVPPDAVYQAAANVLSKALQ